MAKPSMGRSNSFADETGLSMTNFEAIIGLILGAVTLLIVVGVGLRWMLQTWNREDDGDNLRP